MELTQTYVKQQFEYLDGKLLWKIQPSRKKPCIGKVVGCLKRDKSGDRYITKIFKKMEYISRLIFLWHYGWLPTIVDHRDRNKLNDRIENLRATDAKGNARNRTSAKDSSSQYLGVHFAKNQNKWKACIRVNKKLIIIGVFVNEDDAGLAYNEMAELYFGEFASLNNITK